MFKKWISSSLLVLGIAFSHVPAMAVTNLPDFTVLAEQQGPAVVNISITSITKSITVTWFRFYH